MDNTCERCRHGRQEKPGGQKPSPGTIWCSVRNIQMARGRQMPCFSPIGGIKQRRCMDCKRAHMLKPTGEPPQLGYIWCEKRHIEMNKQRNMECFE